MTKPLKHALSSQDVRAKVLQLRDSIVVNLEFIQESIDLDYHRLKAYRDRFGDLNYRPIIGRDTGTGEPLYGPPTELVMEPLASKYRATLKSLLDSIRLIEAEILPEDNPEGATSNAGANDAAAVQGRRAALREGFTKAAAGGRPQSVPLEPQTKLVENAHTAPKAPSSAPMASKALPDSETLPAPRPQRTFVPSSSPAPKDVAGEKTPNEGSATKPLNPQTVGLSPELRARMGGAGRMGALADKYGVGKKKG